MMLRSGGSVFLLMLSLLDTVGFAETKGKEADALIERAKQQSNIRADGASAFQLRSSFAIMRDNGTRIEGTYTETWVSSKLWRREIVTGDFRRITVGNGVKSWQLDNSEPPKGIASVQHLAGFDSAGDWFTADQKQKPIAIKNVGSGPEEIRCIEKSLDPMGGLSELCFGKASGELVAESSPAHTEASTTVESACTYTNYQKFGDKLFPWLIQCFVDRKLTSEAKVIELRLEPFPNGALFEPLPGVRESVNCSQTPVAPKVLYRSAPDLSGPARRSNPGNPVIVSLIVGIDGKPGDVKVISSAGEPFDRASIAAVSQWRFKPAMCSGAPVEMRIDVEVGFH